MGKDQTVLFHSTIFGPIHSRRLGVSLGINLLPNDGKICSFDCIYCEAGYNRQGHGKAGLPSREKVADDLRTKLQEMNQAGERPDVITFSGNGEPTLHPDFAGIVDDVIALRDEYCPQAKVSVLSNSTMTGKADVVSALRKVDNNILKLDSAVEQTMRLIDVPQQPDFTVEKVVEQLSVFADQCIVQTMILRGEHDGQPVDNSTPKEIDALIAAYQRIKPREVMLYSIDRSTPEEKLQKVEIDELRVIAARIEQAGIKVQVN
jgi:wyosine [tRNA(Phe)-imidazoG37] synthetase (radical SAM superfamily)